MTTTTIAISLETREKLRNLGRTGDSYEDVIKKMYELTSKHILKTYLYDTSDSISIHEAKKRLNKSHKKIRE